MIEPNKFYNYYNYKTDKITRKASDVAEYIELFGSCTRDRHARHIQCYSLNVRRYMHRRAWISGGRTEQLDIIAGFLPCHWLYEGFSSAENVHRYMHHA